MSEPPPIVFAEDDPAMIQLLQVLLPRLGRTVHHADNGDAALDLVRRLRPALLVIDLHLPKRTGAEVVRTLRREPDFKDLPVLILTSLCQPDTEDRLREAGADDFLSKPVDLETFLSHARTLLERGRTAA